MVVVELVRNKDGKRETNEKSDGSGWGYLHPYYSVNVTEILDLVRRCRGFGALLILIFVL